MVKYSPYIVLVAIVVRLITQMRGNDDVYFFGVSFSECLLLWVIGLHSKGLFKRVVYFVLGLAAFDVVEPLFRNPNLVYLDEYLYLSFGLTITFIEYVISNHIKRLKRRG